MASSSDVLETVLSDFGRRKTTCGYCRSVSRSSISHGLWAHSLTVSHYQDLLDRGWRRSGCFLYKPEMEKTCCPSYTIRLKASDFVPSKEQLRVAKRMQRFLDGTLDVKKRDECLHRPNMSSDMCSSVTNATISFRTSEPCFGESQGESRTEQYTQYLSDQIDNAVHAVLASREISCSIQIPKACVKKVVPSKKRLLGEGSENLLFTSNVSFQIAATFRRAEKDLSSLKLSSVQPNNHDQYLELSPNMIAEKLASSLNPMADSSGLLIRACNGHINFYSTTKQPWLNDVVEKVSVSNESSTVNRRLKGSCGKKVSDCTREKRQALELRLNRSSFDPEEYALYRKYQIEVHNDAPDHVTESSYKRFLVDTPLTYVPSTGDGTVPPCGFGSFHQQYIIDGRLVAVGVIDILPKCLSSKYLFWDPDLAFLSLGKYSALQEINWVKENELKCPSLGYYYLGYYIHSCNKMRYKASYSPSELLCPLRYQWVPFQIAKPLLDQKLYVVLSDFATLSNEKSCASVESENSVEPEHGVLGREDMNETRINQDEEMDDLELDDSDDSDVEASDLTSLPLEDGSVGDILIGLKGSRFRYKELRYAFGPSERNYLETQLHRYTRVVGIELSEQMAYSLG